MIGHLRGFLIIATMLGSMLLTFRFVVRQESFATVAVAGFLVTVIAAVVIWRFAMRPDVKLSYWTSGLAVFAFTILRLSYPIEYDRSLGWTFFIGVSVALVALVSLVIFLIFKSSDRYERTR